MSIRKGIFVGILGAVLIAPITEGLSYAQSQPHTPLTWHGGPVMDNFVVHTLFFGSGWTTPRKDDYRRYLETSVAWLADINAPAGQQHVLRQYGVGKVQLATSLSGNQFGMDVAARFVPESEIRTIIANAQSQNLLPAYGPRVLIMVCLANTFSSDRGAGPGGGYHGNTGVADQVYAVVVDNGAEMSPCPTSPGICQLGLINHELVEAATNPGFAIDGKKGWFGIDESDEAADRCGLPGTDYTFNGTTIRLGNIADNTNGGACSNTAYAAKPSQLKITRSAAACQVAGVNGVLGVANLDGRDTTGTTPNNNAFGQRVSGSGTTTLICPATGFSSIDVGTLNVEVWKTGSTNVKTKACVNFINGFGGSCGPQDANSGSNRQTLGPSLSEWNNKPNDYRFVLVTMTNAGNAVFGYRQN